MASRSYLQLVRENREFRQLWIAAVISMLGEWFNTIALFFLILEYTGSEFLLGMLFTVRMAGFAISRWPSRALSNSATAPSAPHSDPTRRLVPLEILGATQELVSTPAGRRAPSPSSSAPA